MIVLAVLSGPRRAGTSLLGTPTSQTAKYIEGRLNLWHSNALFEKLLVGSNYVAGRFHVTQVRNAQ